MSADHELILFALKASHDYGASIARALEIPLSEVEEREFEDGEHKARPLVDVRGRDVVVVHSLYGEPGQSANDKLCRLLFFIGALKESGAASVTAVTPYLCYARKDRQTKLHDPVTTKYVAGLFEAVGTDRVMTIDVHNLAAFQNAFRCRTDHLEANPLFVKHFAPLVGSERVAVVSPDIGGTKRAEEFRRLISAELSTEASAAFVEKRRSGGVVSGDTLVGDVAGRVAIVIDDLISTGTTLIRAARACRNAGASRVYAAATHGLFTGDAARIIADSLIDALAVTDTVPPFRLTGHTASARVAVLQSGSLFADAVMAGRAS